MADESTQWDDVRKEEAAAIEKSRNARMPLEHKEAELVGLAISGGGIRSATFGLGVLEGLREKGLLRCVDYLSTVSGGGYIGAWLSANCLRSAKRKQAQEELPNWVDQGADWTESIKHLRRYSNYLSPQLGFFSADTWSMFTVWSRNMLLVQTLVVLAIAAVLLLPRLSLPLFFAWPDAGNCRWLSVILFVLATSGIAGNLMRLKHPEGLAILEEAFWLKGLLGTALLLAAALGLQHRWAFEPFVNGKVQWWQAAVISLLYVAMGLLLLPVAVKLLGVLANLLSKAKKLLWTAEQKECEQSDADSKSKRGPPTRINYTQAWVQGVVVLPMMLTAYLLTAVLWGQNHGHVAIAELTQATSYSRIFVLSWEYWPFPIFIAFASLGLLSFASLHKAKSTKAKSTPTLKLIGVGMLVTLVPMLALHALLCAVVFMMHKWVADFGLAEASALVIVFGPSLILYAFTLVIVLQIGMLGRDGSEGVREWWSRLGAWLGIYGFGWTLVGIAAIFGPYWVEWLAGNLSHVLSVLGVWMGTTLGGLFAGKSAATGSAGKSDSGQQSGLAKGLEVIAAVAPFVFIVGLLLGIATVLHLLVLALMDVPWNSAADLVGSYWEALVKTEALPPALILLGAVAVLLLVFARRIDINEFSLNAFYRNRLSRCYLGASRFGKDERKEQNFTGFDDDDDLKMSELAPPADGAAVPAPLHIVNCALNLGGSSDLSLHTRHSASFILTPFVIGSAYESRQDDDTRKALGFRSHGENPPTLAQAISVSGAAASPNMGYHTSPVVAFLLTVFNVRLGWWFRNPSKQKYDMKFSSSPPFSLSYLVMELFGSASDKSDYLMISDGGHFENLAAYELIRRECSLIIISDGECDPDMNFEGLGTLIRVAEVDFGARIRIDVRPLRPDPATGWSPRSYAEGEIEYASGKKGQLIYLKASMSGTEGTDIMQYKRTHTNFPHETTGDQFYGEDQFESYRKLGKTVVSAALQAG